MGRDTDIMNCKELIYLLEDYCDGSMDERLRGELDDHIRECEPCTAFLNTYRTTRNMMRRPLKPCEIPEEMRARLKSFILEKARNYIGRSVEERHRKVRSFLSALRDGKLPGDVTRRLAPHRELCPECGRYLGSLRPDAEIPDPSGTVEEHLAEFLDAISPGEIPIRG